MRRGLYILFLAFPLRGLAEIGDDVALGLPGPLLFDEFRLSKGFEVSNDEIPQQFSEGSRLLDRKKSMQK